jgi:hypothetical protein
MPFLKPNALNVAIPIAVAMQKQWPVVKLYPIAVRREGLMELRA